MLSSSKDACVVLESRIQKKWGYLCQDLGSKADTWTPGARGSDEWTGSDLGGWRRVNLWRPHPLLLFCKVGTAVTWSAGQVTEMGGPAGAGEGLGTPRVLTVGAGFPPDTMQTSVKFWAW